MSAFSAAAQDEDGDIISALRARVADLEAQLYAVGAGGVGKLEQPQSVTDCHQSQPVAWILRDANNHKVWFLEKTSTPTGYRGEWIKTPLYTHPQPKREPLTEMEINTIWRNSTHRTTVDVVRAIEAAHGIGGEA